MEERSSSKKIQFTPLSDFRFPSVFGYQTGIKKPLEQSFEDKYGF